MQKQESYLKSVMDQINYVSNELAKVSYNIETTEENLRTTKIELQVAEERISARESLLESRVRFMYTDGSVSYLDVLLSSTSFTDFLKRMDSLKMIANQDQSLLAEHKKDKQLVVVKKQQLDEQYLEHKRLYAEKKARKGELARKEQEKQKLIAGYKKEIETQSELSDRQDRMLVEIALKRSALIQEKNEMKEEQAAKAAKAKAAAKEAERKNALQKISSSNNTPSKNSYPGGKGVFGMPIKGAYISSNFGPRVHPITGEVGKMHNGTDFAAPQGTSIYAAEDGVVIMAEWYGGYGNTVIVDHGDGLWTLYPHIRENGILVKEGESVTRGQNIAEVGSTGNSTGPHLHFEVRVNGNPQNPLSYL
ncbi:peptidoglycan DD-metalloendopeptidase family protein [Paenibacillus sp. UMB7766-LJ446]|uniref:murein hydrolase activator EnvC family protein n=1 Tax=Paenibacillus sp. UMB7766-LJ446 TaxID=3046313 RepID=UPI00254CC576|nr:M23 family metallopeptidase [Paenibacillus sp. UMB7766-LJ446]MDK8193080.1 peptidoglycan DD-metalloendopeptidase family protein [Paenibacillus sp. UMB7766-LJ446]